jgi:hypothetical protein
LAPCRNQLDFILSKKRLMPQYDNDASTAAITLLVVTLPTKHDHCGVVASPPFTCSASGEIIGCTLYDRLENKVTSTNIFSPGNPQVCILPRELTIISIQRSSAVSPRADVNFNSGTFDSGWVDIDLTGDPGAAGFPQHTLTGLNPNQVDLLSIGLTGFQGLPALTLVLQEYFNGNVGGVFGNSIESPYEVFYTPLLS